MRCALCPEPLEQAPLSDWHGLAAHADCAAQYAAMEADLIAGLEAMILAEPRRAMHRHSVRP